jgi:hypothetical protein
MDAYNQYQYSMDSLEWLKYHISHGNKLTQKMGDYNPFFAICSNEKITTEILDWLIKSTCGINLIKPNKFKEYPVTKLFTNRALNIELFALIINFIVENDQLYIIHVQEQKTGQRYDSPIRKLIGSDYFTPPMLKILLDIKPDIVMCSYAKPHGFLHCLISRSDINLVGEFLLIFRMYYKDFSLEVEKFIHACRFPNHVNRITYYSNTNYQTDTTSPIQLLIGLCGVFYKLIKRQLITFEISLHFFNSEWFKTHPEEIKFIPQEFRTGLYKFGTKTKSGFRPTDPDLDLI